MKIIMPGLSGPDWDGHIVGWAPGHVVDIPDDNEKAVAWARGWLAVEGGYRATLVEDVAAPPPAEPTLAELRAQAEAKGLPTYGSKAQLQERLASGPADNGE